MYEGLMEKNIYVTMKKKTVIEGLKSLIRDCLNTLGFSKSQFKSLKLSTLCFITIIFVSISIAILKNFISLIIFQYI